MSGNETQPTDVLELLVTPGDAGDRLDRFVSRRLGGLSRSRAAAIVKSRILDGPWKPGTRVQAGQTLRLQLRVKARREQDFPLSILYADPSLVVVDKPAGQLVHPPRRGITNTLVERLEEELGEGIRLAHRLDRETSGVLVAARTPGAARELSVMFQEHKAVKVYLAVVEGVPAPSEGTITLPLGRDPDSAVHDRQRIDRERGRPALTHYRLLRSHDGRSLVEARPQTGRLHQIRVHLASLGTPVVGDKIYGPDENLFLRFIRGDESQPPGQGTPPQRHALHASSLRIHHPDTGAVMDFHAPLPADMAALVP